MKKVILTLGSIFFLLSYTTQLIPITLEASESAREESTLTIASNKIKEEQWEQAHPSPFNPISIAFVTQALVAAGLGWLVNEIANFGAYLSCRAQGMNMYRHSIAGRYNPGSFAFYSYCSSKGWL